MVDVSTQIETPATSFSLMSLAEAKIALGVTNTTYDAMIEGMIERNSDWLARLANRTFAQETVIDTFRFVSGTRIYLSHWPVDEDDITSVTSGGVVVTDYSVDEVAGKLERSSWIDPVVVSYTGGYDLPADAPPALKQALVLTMQDKFTAGGTIRDAGVRMISHKEARVMYYQATNSATTGASIGGNSSASSQAIDSLLRHYVRLWV